MGRREIRPWSKENFFNRTINQGNNLPPEIVAAPSMEVSRRDWTIIWPRWHKVSCLEQGIGLPDSRLPMILSSMSLDAILLSAESFIALSSLSMKPSAWRGSAFLVHSPFLIPSFEESRQTFLVVHLILWNCSPLPKHWTSYLLIFSRLSHTNVLFYWCGQLVMLLVMWFGYFCLEIKHQFEGIAERL